MTRRLWQPAHTQKMTVHLLWHVTEHGPRGAKFEAAKRRMKQLGLVKCAIQGCDTGAPIEYHHSKIENSLVAGVDLRKFNREYGLHLSDAEFVEYIQSPGNLEALCSVHHRTQLGIHAIPEPGWAAIRVWKDKLAPPVEHVTADQWKDM
jgi:hypothetical protein